MNNRSGLSLFELLISLALLALIAAGLAGALGLAVNIWNRSAVYSTASEEIILRSRLRVWLNNAIPPSRLTSFPSSFKGNTEGFSFVTLSHTPNDPNAAAMRVSVTYQDEQLEITVSTLRDDGEVNGVFRSKLGADIQAKFTYYQEGAGWREKWPDENALPRLIQIEALAQTNPEWPVFLANLSVK